MALQRKGVISYCVAGIAFHMLTSAFNFYYVKIYLHNFHIKEAWLQFALLIHMIWSSLCNPVLAFIQDNNSIWFTRTRRESILYTGPLFALSFVLPWFPISSHPWLIGLQLTGTLLLWDTMFTFVGLALSALFTEFSKETEDRIKLTRYAQMASLLGGPSVMLLEFTSNSLHNFSAFQVTASFLSLVAAMLFLYTGKNAVTEYDELCGKKNDDLKSKNIDDSEPYMTKILQIVFNRNFIAFVVVNFCNGFHKSFLNSFISIICDELVTEEQIPSSIRKTFYGSISMISTLVILSGVTLFSRHSYYSIIRSTFVYIVLAGLVMLHIGPSHPWLLMLYLLADNCATGAAFSLFNMPIADIIDENKIKYKRRYPISSTVFSASNVISKPSFSLSSMVTVAILNNYGYGKILENSLGASEELKHMMFLLVCLFPIIVGTVQLVAWSFFTDNHKTQEINVI